MAKAEWGNKRTCPKCGTRFYDLGNDDPTVCIECGESWKHEPILKARPSVVARPEKKKPEVEEVDEDDELVKEAGIIIDADEDDDDEDDDSIIADVSLDDEDENLDEVVSSSITKTDD